MSKFVLPVMLTFFTVDSLMAGTASAALKCNDEFAKTKVQQVAEAERMAHVTVLRKMGREATFSIGKVYEIETVSTDTSTGVTKCSAKVQASSNWGMLGLPVNVSYQIGTYDDTGEKYTKVEVLPVMK